MWRANSTHRVDRVCQSEGTIPIRNVGTIGTSELCKPEETLMREKSIVSLLPSLYPEKEMPNVDRERERDALEVSSQRKEISA